MQEEKMVNVTRLELTWTQLAVLREAWENFDTNRLSAWTDDHDRPMSDEWLELIDVMFDNARFDTWRTL
jgi:hypothetical protein